MNEILTKEKILEKIDECDYSWFVELQYDHPDVCLIEEDNDGDGNEMTLTLKFTEANLFVTLKGVYSSWDSSEWTDVFISEPKEYTLVRYERIP